MAAGVAGSENDAADGAEPDPWFGPGPKVPAAADPPEPALADALESHGAPGSAGPPAAAAAQGAADPAARAVWFLPTGRAALLPESMTVSSAEDQSGKPRAEYGARIAAAGAPPWAGEVTGPVAGAPPPWETGPWPGPGADRASRTADGPAPGSLTPGGASGNGVPAGVGRQSLASQPPASASRSARAVLTAGLVPLVIPGLVAGVLGVRRSNPGEPVRRASILAIAASLAWVVIIVLAVASTSGGSTGSCRYPAAVHQSYARAVADLSGNAQASVKVADLGLAASRANAAAAATATGDISVRSALFAMTADLQQARADIIANRPVPDSLRAHLAADGTALTSSCQS